MEQRIELWPRITQRTHPTQHAYSLAIHPPAYLSHQTFFSSGKAFKTIISHLLNSGRQIDFKRGPFPGCAPLPGCTQMYPGRPRGRENAAAGPKMGRGRNASVWHDCPNTTIDTCFSTASWRIETAHGQPQNRLRHSH